MLNFNDDDDLKDSNESENNLNKNNDKQDNSNSVNALLPLDDDRIIVRDENGEEIANENIEENEEIDPAEVVTKHDFVSSPWTKLSIVGGFFAIGFGVMYLSLNSLMGGGSGETAKKAEPIPTPTSTPFAEQKDGDAYAKLALQKQETDLQNLNGKEEAVKEEDKITEEKDNKTTNTKQNTTTTKTDKRTNTTANTTTKGNKTRSTTNEENNNNTRRTSTRRQNNNSNNSGSTNRESSTRRNTLARVPTERPSKPVTTTIPKITLPSDSSRSTIANNNGSNKSNSNTDPLANIERLRGLSSLGRINYNKNTNTTIVANSNTGDSSSSISSETLESRRRRGSRNNNATSSNNTDNNNNRNDSNRNNSNNEIQKLTPKWEPRNMDSGELRAQNKQMNLMNVSYEAEESQILEERAPQYLVVGSSTKATLVTPLMIAGDKPNKNLRFIAQLSEPIKSNTGNIAIPAGTQVAITVHGVDGGFGMDAEVVGILKDGTEYPISPGTITVLAKGGNPLIARPYKGKGGEIAGYDITLGAIAGLAKVGEIINQPDESTTAITPFGGTVTSTSGNRRNIPGAFLEGAFGALASNVGKRTQTATTEVTSRPNVWYVPAKTQITLRVNRSIQL